MSTTLSIISTSPHAYSKLVIFIQLFYAAYYNKYIIWPVLGTKFAGSASNNIIKAKNEKVYIEFS